MKHLPITTIAAVLLMGCGESQQSTSPPEAKPVALVAEAAKPEPPTAKAPEVLIREAVKTGNIKAVKQHLDAGVDVNAIGKYGRTPLHYAATRGLKKIIELLIARGADVNTKIEVGDYKGHTPLDGAIQWNHPETADLLRKHGGKTGEELEAGN